MKFDKRNYKHWSYLLRFTAITCLAWLTRAISIHSRPQIKTIVLYGHKFNGNLKALYYELQKHPDEFQVFFLTMDKIYATQLKQEGLSTLDGTKINTCRVLADTDVIVSDHGLHSLELLLHFSSIKFIDVWHGIPFKGFDKKDFRVQHSYDEIWVTSDLLKKMYVEKFGFRTKQIVITGYGRTDKLVNNTQNITDLKRRHKITDPSKPVILFAPTWSQDTKGRNLYPFDLDEVNFLKLAKELCQKNNAYMIIRHHLNSSEKGNDEESIIYLPSSQYPDTEDILLISDILVCDWSSIAFDYLTLQRPTLFLNVPPPFSKGFSLTPDYRFGNIISDADILQRSITRCLKNKDDYWRRQLQAHQKTSKILYGHTLDGISSSRGVERIRKITPPEFAQ